jgi:hypothetical protein
MNTLKLLYMKKFYHLQVQALAAPTVFLALTEIRKRWKRRRSINKKKNHQQVDGDRQDERKVTI